MIEKVNHLRKIALKIDASGEVIPIGNTTLYQGSFGFTELQVYVPITQNMSSTTMPLCTVYRTVIDSAGNPKQFNNDVYNLVNIETVDGYMLFQCPLPRSFTETVGELEIVINYSEICDGVTVARLATKTYKTNVLRGGITTGEIVDPISGELAKLNKLGTRMEGIEDSVDKLLVAPDVSEANRIGDVDVKINVTRSICNSCNVDIEHNIVERSNNRNSISIDGIVSISSVVADCNINVYTNDISVSSPWLSSGINAIYIDEPLNIESQISNGCSSVSNCTGIAIGNLECNGIKVGYNFLTIHDVLISNCLFFYCQLLANEVHLGSFGAFSPARGT